jgi:hypothetical protein
VTFPIIAQLRASGLSAASFLAPGGYDDFADGTVRLSASPASAVRKGDRGYPQSFKDEKGTFGRLQIDEPSLVVISDRLTPLLLHFKDSASISARMPSSCHTLVGSTYPTIYPLPTASLRFGIAKPTVRKLQFLINSPKLPK